MAKRNVELQLEKILDEGQERDGGVIVRMESRAADAKRLLASASQRMLERSLSVSARDLLPGTKDRSRRRKSSVRSKLAGATLRAMIDQSKRSVRSLLRGAAIGKYSDRAAKGALAQFWSSKSVLIEMPKDDLARMARETEDIGDIYPNRRLRMPRVVEAKSLPANVTDNKVSAWGVHAIGSMAVWGAFNSRGKGTKVGVLDTGVDAGHPDLNGKVTDWAEFNFNGQPVPGSTPHDTDRHGTHVCGTVAGGNGSGRWVGVAPEAKLAVAIVLDGNSGGTDAQVLAGMDWALERGVDVLSMSLGGLTIGPEVPATYSEAMLTFMLAGVPVVTAIGNEGSQTTGSPGNDLLALAVGASDSLDRAAGFSGGRTQIIHESTFIPPEFLPLPYSKPDISAPGVAILSSIPGSQWAAFNGTSMATPHVAGAIALLLSATTIRNDVNGADRAFLIQDLMTGSVEELGESGQDHRFGFGRLDALRATGFAKERGY